MEVNDVKELSRQKEDCQDTEFPVCLTCGINSRVSMVTTTFQTKLEEGKCHSTHRHGRSCSHINSSGFNLS